MTDILKQKNQSLYTSIDVVIPVYNGQKFIIQALCSVVQQTYPPAKIIVVDDGSTDKTPELVQNFKSNVPIEYVRKTNGGLSSARNAGISRCTSDCIAFLDADDEWYPEKLKEQIQVFKESDLQNLGVVYCKYNIIDENGDINNRYHISELDRSVRGNVFNKLLEGNKIASSGSGVLVKKECFDKAGGFDEILKACEDWDMWLRLAEHYEFDFVPTELVRIRRHHENMQRDKLHMLANRLKFYEKWLQKRSVNNMFLPNWRRQIIYYLIENFPSVEVISLTKDVLSEGSRQKLFKSTFGSVELYIFISMPLIIIGLTFRLVAGVSMVLKKMMGSQIDYS